VIFDLVQFTHLLENV